jgi:hypothetical protein
MALGRRAAARVSAALKHRVRREVESRRVGQTEIMFGDGLRVLSAKVDAGFAAESTTE